MNVACTNVRQVHSQFSFCEMRKITSMLYSCEQFASLPVVALIGESHREEVQAHIILLNSDINFRKTASASPSQPCPHKAYLGKSFSMFGQNKEKQNDTKL